MYTNNTIKVTPNGGQIYFNVFDHQGPSEIILPKDTSLYVDAIKEMEDERITLLKEIAKLKKDLKKEISLVGDEQRKVKEMEILLESYRTTLNESNTDSTLELQARKKAWQEMIIKDLYESQVMFNLHTNYTKKYLNENQRAKADRDRGKTLREVEEHMQREFFGQRYKSKPSEEYLKNSRGYPGITNKLIAFREE